MPVRQSPLETGLGSGLGESPGHTDPNTVICFSSAKMPPPSGQNGGRSLKLTRTDRTRSVSFRTRRAGSSRGISRPAMRLKSCTMIVTEPNAFAAETHDRMPVFLTEQQFGPSDGPLEASGSNLLSLKFLAA